MPAPGQMAPHRDNAHFAKMLDAAAKLGDGNVSEGIRVALKKVVDS